MGDMRFGSGLGSDSFANMASKAARAKQKKGKDSANKKKKLAQRAGEGSLRISLDNFDMDYGQLRMQEQLTEEGYAKRLASEQGELSHTGTKSGDDIVYCPQLRDKVK